MRHAATAIALATLLAQPAQATTPLCTALETMVKAAMEPVEYASLRGKGVKGEAGVLASKLILPGFDLCQIVPSIHDFTCYASGLTTDKAAALEASVKGEIEVCMGEKMVRDNEFALNPWALREKAGSYPLLLLTNVSGKQITFSFRLKGLRG